MVFIKELVLLLYIQQSLSLNISPNSQVPHANILDEVLEATYFQNYTEEDSISVFDYLFKENFTDLENAEVSEHLDICMLSPENIKKVVDEAKRKEDLIMGSYNESFKGDSRRQYVKKSNYNITKAMDWMKQSIYGTRRRLEATRPYRKKFLINISYNIGILYGILKEMSYKMDSLYTAMRRINLHFKFIWHLIPYQRILAFNVDITYVVARLFQFHKKWNEIMGKGDRGSEERQHEGTINLDILKAIPDIGALGPEIESFFHKEFKPNIPSGPDAGAERPHPGARPQGM